MVPIPYIKSNEDITFMRQKFQETCASFPEYKSKGTFQPTCYYKPPALWCNQYQLGSFGALSNLGSFHNEFVRDCRKCISQVLEPMLREAFPEYPFSQTLFDRLKLRPVGTHLKSRSLHRDKSTASEHRRVFQGWMNLDYHAQFFSFLPGTHQTGNQNDGRTGFALEKDNDSVDIATTHKEKLCIPPGHFVIFDQTVIHEVQGVSITKYHSMRVHVGFCLCTHPDYGFCVDKYKQAMETQGLPPLPSEQIPPMYSKMHQSALKYKITIPWSNMVIADQFKEHDDQGYLILPPTMQKISLMEFGLNYALYSENEKTLMLPHRIG